MYFILLRTLMKTFFFLCFEMKVIFFYSRSWSLNFLKPTMLCIKIREWRYAVVHELWSKYLLLTTRNDERIFTRLYSDKPDWGKLPFCVGISTLCNRMFPNLTVYCYVKSSGLRSKIDGVFYLRCALLHWPATLLSIVLFDF